LRQDSACAPLPSAELRFFIFYLNSFLIAIQHASISIFRNQRSNGYIKMRALTEEETKIVFTKLANYTGRSLNQLIQPPDDNERYVFRVQGSRVHYVRLSVANLATSVARDNLLSLGICLGKFTKTMKFRLHITAYVP
jgi:UPF0113 Pre-PUA domain